MVKLMTQELIYAVLLHAKFHLDMCIVLPRPEGRKIQNWALFSNSTFSGSAIYSSAETKLNAHEQLEIVPIQRHQKCF